MRRNQTIKCDACGGDHDNADCPELKELVSLASARCYPSPAQRLTKAGWQRRKNGWKSPYTRNVLAEEKALRVEDFMVRDPVTDNIKAER
jgi:hypothetical protein